MTSIILCGGIAIIGATSLAGIWLALRQRAYNRYFKYSPRQNAALGLSPSAIETVPLRASADGFIMPDIATGAVCGLLEVEVITSLTGRFCDPFVELSTDHFCDTQVLERGVCGVRFLNISRLLTAGVTAGSTVMWRGGHLAIKPDSARLHLSRDKLQTDERVLIISAHPDDAEIAAFGLYSTTHSTVVNVTAGDASTGYHSSSRLAMTLSRSKVARMRVLDSLVIPQTGGVGPDKTLNLCYPDGQLSEMRLHPTRDFRGDGVNALDFPGLRQINSSPLMRASTECSWNSLVRDLAHILEKTKPTVIVTPHPILDSHADHLAATAAVCEALRHAGLTDGRFFFTCVHNVRSELWPFGPAGSGVAPLPVFETDGDCADGYYSHPLTKEQQTDKFLAMEAMHDLRNMEWPVAFSSEGGWRRVRAELRALAHGLGRVPTNYLRRAVRPDEVFLTSSYTNGRAMCEKALDPASPNCPL